MDYRTKEDEEATRKRVTLLGDLYASQPADDEVRGRCAVGSLLSPALPGPALAAAAAALPPPFLCFL